MQFARIKNSKAGKKLRLKEQMEKQMWENLKTSIADGWYDSLFAISEIKKILEDGSDLLIGLDTLEGKIRDRRITKEGALLFVQNVLKK